MIIRAKDANKEIPMPDGMDEIQVLLTPFLKDRQEIGIIRRVLSSHLDFHQHLSRPLSLSESSEITSSPQGSQGLQKDYLRALRLNAKAKNNYTSLLHDLEQKPGPHKIDLDAGTPKRSFLNLVHARQKYSRLKVIQDYIDTLNKKHSASGDHLDFSVELQEKDPAPPIPSEVLNAAVTRCATGDKLHELIDRLEKSVLRAKVLLKRERRFLSKVQSKYSQHSIQQGTRLGALGTTRNELITWIETELSRAGEGSSIEGESRPVRHEEELGARNLQGRLENLLSHYARYVSLRANLVPTTSEEPLTVSTPRSKDDTVTLQPEHATACPPPMIALTSYLGDLISLSNEQKSVVQQKSCSTVAFSKHLKTTGQLLDRLVDESHLLPAYPLTTKEVSQRPNLGVSISFADEITNTERPDLPQRAQAWVSASDSARRSLREVVSDNLDEGGSALLEAQEHLLGLLGFLGNGFDAKVHPEEDMPDTWAVLNGKLGAI